MDSTTSLDDFYGQPFVEVRINPAGCSECRSNHEPSRSSKTPTAKCTSIWFFVSPFLGDPKSSFNLQQISNFTDPLHPFCTSAMPIIHPGQLQRRLGMAIDALHLSVTHQFQHGAGPFHLRKMWQSGWCFYCVCICIYVYAYVCIRVYIYKYKWTYIHTCIHTHTNIHTHTLTQTHTQAYAYTNTYTNTEHYITYLCLDIYIYVCVCIVFIYLSIYLFMYLFHYFFIYVCIYLFMPAGGKPRA